MSCNVAVIVLADQFFAPARQAAQMDAAAATTSSDKAMEMFGSVHSLVRGIQGVGLPMVLVGPEACLAQAKGVLTPDQLLEIDAPVVHMQRSDWLIKGIAAAVMACSGASGWMILPADMPMVQGTTLLRIGQALQENLLVYPCHAHRRGHPVGFSSELFSELVQLHSEQDMRRLMARYPAADVHVNDAGVAMTAGHHPGLDQWRAHFGANPLPPGHPSPPSLHY